ncbi:MAG: formylglycine-generating enzyme family protein [Mariprofundaceae bacterium]|nr:formylglycine-generating enzyme family protein [Mariprofundaceae bacterium]
MRKIAVLWLMLGSLMVPFAAWAELPADVRKDMYMQDLVKQFKAENYNKVLTYIDQLRALTTSDGLVMPVVLSYFEGKASLETKDYMRAHEALTRYVEKTGKEGRYYRESLTMILAIGEPDPISGKIKGDEAIFDGIAFVWVPSGEFMMGSNDGGKDEKPVHKVQINKGFWLGKYEVTQAQWQRVMGINPSTFKGNDLPVETVSWNDIQGYLKKLGNGYRLPTEAEWEYAARAGTTTPFMTGQCISTDQANYNGSNSVFSYKDCPKGEYRKTTMAVGSFSPNAWGLYDMHGNVWEWTADCSNKSYTGAPSNGSAWLSGTCEQRVLRGGSWSNSPWSLRSANRGGNNSGNRDGTIGFRVVLSASSVQD